VIDMFHKSIVTVLGAALMAGSAIQTAGAQPFNDGRGNSGPSYEQGYADGYHHGWDDFRTKAPFNDRGVYSPPVNFPQRPDMRGDDAVRRWQDQYQRQYSYQDDNYYRECRTQSDPGGIIAGALIGGILGNAITSGGRGGGGQAVGTIAGVVLGGALGASLTRNMDCDDRSYAYNTYYNGFNSGRAGVPYQWRNPSNGHYGDFRVNDYYNDQSGFRCANFAQQVYVGRRPQMTNGRACQQPDGTWAVIN
jgi:surface antigen